MNKVIDLDPNFVRTYYYIMYPFLAKGLIGEAVEKPVARMQAAGESMGDVGEIHKAYETSGILGVARTRIGQMLRKNPDLITIHIQLVVLTGDHGPALNYIERVVRILEPGLCDIEGLSPVGQPSR